MGLRLGDLKDNVDHIFEIDSFKSKMGTDADIVTLSFSVKEKHEHRIVDCDGQAQKRIPHGL